MTQTGDDDDDGVVGSVFLDGGAETFLLSPEGFVLVFSQKGWVFA